MSPRRYKPRVGFGLMRPEGAAASRLIAIALCVGLLVAASIGGATAEAHTKEYRAYISAEYPQGSAPGPFVLQGSVTSGKAACVANRNVSVFGIQLGPLGPGFAGPSTLLARTTTDQAGHYSVTLPDHQAYPDFYAVAKWKRLLMNTKHRHSCRAATSLCLSGHSCPAYQRAEAPPSEGMTAPAPLGRS
jgi:hypothetical protein